MDILVGDISCKVLKTRSHMAALALIRQTCRARPEGYVYMPRYKAGLWDGYISLMLSFSSFPTGLLSLVTNALTTNNIDYNLVFGVAKPESPIVAADSLVGITLRNYQVDATNKLLAAGRGVAKMATNSGKTEVIAAIIKALALPAIVIVHRRELMYQTAERIAQRLGLPGHDVGLIGDEQHIHKTINVAMIQSLYNEFDGGGHFDWLANNGVVVVDECHHLSSPTMLNVVHNIGGHYRYGFSGTPLKYELLPDLRLMGATGEVIVDVTNDQLIQNGYSATPEIIMYTLDELDKPDYWDIDYDIAYGECIVYNDARNGIIVKEAKQNPGVTLILVSRIEHGEILQRLMPGSFFIHGSDSMEYRHNVIGLMATGQPGIYIASTILDEGVDMPGVDMIILAGGGASNTKTLQRIGRGLRHKEGRNTLRVVDFIDGTNEYLHNHSLERQDTYGLERFQVEICSQW